MCRPRPELPAFISSVHRSATRRLDYHCAHFPDKNTKVPRRFILALGAHGQVAAEVGTAGSSGDAFSPQTAPLSPFPWRQLSLTMTSDPELIEGLKG